MLAKLCRYINLVVEFFFFLLYLFINFPCYLFRSAPVGFLSYTGLLASSPIGTNVAIYFRYVLYFLRACIVERQLSGYPVTLDMQLFRCIFNNDFVTRTYIINLKSYINILIAVSRQKMS